MEEENKLKSLSVEYQKTRDKLQSLAVQRERFSSQKNEYIQAETEITKSTGKIYSAVGSVMVETSKEEALNTIQERKEMLDLRLNMINKQSSELTDKEKQQREEIESIFKNQNKSDNIK